MKKKDRRGGGAPFKYRRTRPITNPKNPREPIRNPTTQPNGKTRNPTELASAFPITNPCAHLRAAPPIPRSTNHIPRRAVTLLSLSYDFPAVLGRTRRANRHFPSLPKREPRFPSASKARTTIFLALLSYPPSFLALQSLPAGFLAFMPVS